MNNKNNSLVDVLHVIETKLEEIRDKGTKIESSLSHVEGPKPHNDKIDGVNKAVHELSAMSRALMATELTVIRDKGTEIESSLSEVEGPDPHNPDVLTKDKIDDINKAIYELSMMSQVLMAIELIVKGK